MFKFLRKYNKVLLAVFGTILMIIFLIPTAITQLSRQAGASGAKVATYGNGKTVSAKEWKQVQDEVLFMRNAGIQVQSLGIIDRPEHWYLLVREAEEAGLVGKGGVLSADEMATFANQGGVNSAFVDRAFSRLLGVNTLVQLYRTAGKFSDRRLRHEAERLLHEVEASLVIIDADPDKSTLQPTEAELQAQFEAYADLPKGEGDWGFGYRLPDRVKVEWISIPAADVQSMIEADPDALSGLALRRHWNEFANLDGLPAVETGVAVPAVVRDHLLEELTQAKLTEVAKWTSDELQTPRRGLPQSSGYYVLPEDWQARRLPLDELAESTREHYPGLPLPSYHATGDRWYEPGELIDLGPVASATTEKFGTLASLMDLAEAAREFGQPTTLFTQEGVAGPPLSSPGGDLFIYRIIDTDAARRPASLDEVRDVVLADLRSLDHYETIKSQRQAIELQARTQGLLALAAEHDTIVQPPAQVMLSYSLRFQIDQPISAPLPVIGVNEQASNAIIDMALTLPRTRNLSQVSASLRIVAVALDDRPSLVVARLERQTPLTDSLYELLVSQQRLQQMVTYTETDGSDTTPQAFSYELLAARHNFSFTSGDEDDAAAADDASTQTASADVAGE